MYRVCSKYAKKIYFRSVIIIFFSLLSNVSLMLYTVCISNMINNVAEKNYAILIRTLSLLMFYFALMLMVDGMTIRAKRWAEYQNAYELRSEFLEHLYSIPMYRLDELGRSNITNRYKDELDKIIAFYVNSFPDMVKNCTLFILISIYVFNENKVLFIIMLCAVPVVCMCIKQTNRKIGVLSKSLTELDVNRNTLEYDALASKVELKCFGAYEFIMRKVEEAEGAFRKTSYKKNACFTFVWGIKIFAFIVISNIILAIGGGMAMKGQVTFGAITSLIVIMDNIVSSVFSFPEIYSRCMEIRPFIERYNKWQKIDRERLLSDLMTDEKDIIYGLRHVGYQYDDVNILENLTLDIKRGKKYLFVGKSGIGKSTLLKILIGYDDRYNGIARFKGRELSEWSHQSIRKQLIYTSGDMLFVSGTVRELFVLIYPEIPDNEIRSCMEMVELSFSNEFYIEKGGSNISGGERQRLYLALFIASKRDIMIMDECLSMVSLPQQVRIMQRILSAQQITCIWVDHRIQPDIIALFDEIIFLDDEKRIHSGSYEEIRKLQSFNALFTERRSSYAE